MTFGNQGFYRPFVVNIELLKMLGEQSEGMLFDIGYDNGIRPVLAVPEHPVPNGASGLTSTGAAGTLLRPRNPRCTGDAPPLDQGSDCARGCTRDPPGWLWVRDRRRVSIRLEVEVDDRADLGRCRRW